MGGFNFLTIMPEPKFKRNSPVFDKLNLDRLKKCAETISRAEDYVRGAKHQIEQTKRLLEKIKRVGERRSSRRTPAA